VPAVAAPLLTPGASAQHHALYFGELAVLLDAGLALDDALLKAGDSLPTHYRNATAFLASHVGRGEGLADGMRHYTALFNPVIVAMTRAGEAGGRLPECFRMLGEFFEREAELVRTLRSAAVYPIIVMITAVLAVGVLWWIGFMEATWAVRILWGAAIAACIWLVLRFKPIQQLARNFVMILPFFGAIMHQLAVARFCHIFGMQVRSGVPYLEGLESAKPAIQHPHVSHAVNHVYAGVRNGNTIESAIRSQPTFPPVVRNLVGAGEASGELDVTLIKAAEYLRTDAEMKIRNSAKVAGPAMVILAGIIVLFILIGFFNSYFDMIFSLAEE
jgi:type IV pilus assembly protein PilC